MAYDKEYYEKNKDKFRSASKKYRARIREEKIVNGILKPKVTFTEEERKEKYDKRRMEINERYKNDQEFREKCRKNFSDRWHSDAEFRKNRREYDRAYLREWRAKRRASKKQNETAHTGN